jgi:hypothetical protein
MRTEYLAAIAIAALTAGAGLAAYSVRGEADLCSQPSAASVTAFFTPCLTFDTAMGHTVSKSQAVRMGLLKPDDQPAPNEQPAQPVIRLADRLAASVDPFLRRSGG